MPDHSPPEPTAAAPPAAAPPAAAASQSAHRSGRTDEERFAALVESTHMALLAYAVRRVTVPADAADVVAETFLVAWRRIAEVPAGPDARPWLFGVARKVLANVRRTDHRRSALADRLRAHVVEVVGPAELGGSAVEQALGRLRDADQEILRLSAWEQLEHDEIAVALGLSRGAVRVRLHRARRRLAETLRGIERSDDALPWTAARASGADARLVVARPVIEEGR